MDALEKMLDMAQARARRERRRWESRSREDRYSVDDLPIPGFELRKRAVLPNTQPTEVEEYADFLLGYLLVHPDKEIHYYDRPLATADYRTVTKNFTLPPLFGANAVTLLVASDFEVFYRDLGHNSLLFNRGGRAYHSVGIWTPAVYSDVDHYLRRR